MQNTAIRLKQIMKDRNLRQVDIIRLAEPYCKEFNLKLTKSDMSQFVSGKVEPGQWKLTILGKALGVSEVWLMGYDVPMEREEPAPAQSTASESLSVKKNAEEVPGEDELMRIYRSVNEDGKKHILYTARLVSGNPDMQKEPSGSKAM